MLIYLVENVAFSKLDLKKRGSGIGFRERTISGAKLRCFSPLFSRLFRM
jgi:hypothetical protein